MFSSYEKVFQNSCIQESKKAPLTGYKPKEGLYSVVDSFLGLFFLASLIYCTMKKRYLMVTVQMFLRLRDGRWFDHETLCPVVHTLNKTAF